MKYYVRSGQKEIKEVKFLIKSLSRKCYIEIITLTSEFIYTEWTNMLAAFLHINTNIYISTYKCIISKMLNILYVNRLLNMLLKKYHIWGYRVYGHTEFISSVQMTLCHFSWLMTESLTMLTWRDRRERQGDHSELLTSYRAAKGCSSLPSGLLH